MIKRISEPRFLPDPTGFNDWHDWARQFKSSIEQRYQADQSVIPFFEFATVQKDASDFPSLAANTIEWDEVVEDFTTGANPPVWDAGDKTKLIVPTRAGEIQYGYAMLVASVAVSQSSGSNADSNIKIDTNGVAYEPRSGATSKRVFSGSRVYILQAVQPWKPVKPGDFFQVKWESNRSGLLNVMASDHTYFQIILAGPERGV